jgi:hypothetical protein
MKEIRTEIEIQAAPEMVWQTIIDLEKWTEWNPFIHHIIGKAKLGEEVDITVTSQPKDMILHCTVIKTEPNKELRWKYHVVSPFLFRGEHSFIIEKTKENRIRFIDREICNGLLVFTQAKNMDTATRRGFEEMDIALKERVEGS